MREDVAFTITDMQVDDLRASDRVTWLRSRAPAPPTLHAFVDLANDRIIITDRKTRRWLDMPAGAKNYKVADALHAMDQDSLHALWAKATPV